MTAPAPLRVGIGLWCAAAAFLLVQALFSFTGVSGLEQELADSGVAAGDAADRARALLTTNLVLAIVLAAVYAGLGFMLGSRRAWVRIVLTIVAFGHVIMVLATLATSVQNLITLVLLVAAVACTWKRDSSEWLHGEH
ncbi:hypothetical protein GIY23_20930 [Allosaccharopolyspora coralli]|uniref:DUF1304 family protein n=1 Tax=Allosaccharopolyspora coralli TaxID=2665642 RepID=A0A5Q3QB94_9PSEU|nr:hypothetical protein [Allosaccharopolyspora coralli]QGK71653.1 hypothetical protein GIY23_20930 [Allosaccharopolyspora coralli]